MPLDPLLNNKAVPDEPRQALTQSIEMIESGIREVRTLSHLLHPPMLDEVGFAAAADWYVQGFSERSKIKVTLNVSQDLGRLSKGLELVLFRVLQEGLTNIHRHSGSAAADVTLRRIGRDVRLTIQDEGKGIPAARLREFRISSLGSGVGLAGMRERVSEFGGKLDIRSEGRGTVLEVILPLTHEKSPQGVSGPPESEAASKPMLDSGDPGNVGILMIGTPA
jgi:two-component system, NarL family, sensor kinase